MLLIHNVDCKINIPTTVNSAACDHHSMNRSTHPSKIHLLFSRADESSQSKELLLLIYTKSSYSCLYLWYCDKFTHTFKLYKLINTTVCSYKPASWKHYWHTIKTLYDIDPLRWSKGLLTIKVSYFTSLVYILRIRTLLNKVDHTGVFILKCPHQFIKPSTWSDRLYIAIK